MTAWTRLKRAALLFFEQLAAALARVPFKLQVAAILLLAALLSLWRLNGPDLWVDEAISYWIARKPLLEVLSYSLSRAWEHPPLYYVLLHAWMSVAGDSEFALRAFSWMGMTLAVAVLVTLARQVERAALRARRRHHCGHEPDAHQACPGRPDVSLADDARPAQRVRARPGAALEPVARLGPLRARHGRGHRDALPDQPRAFLLCLVCLDPLAHLACSEPDALRANPRRAVRGRRRTVRGLPRTARQPGRGHQALPRDAAHAGALVGRLRRVGDWHERRHPAVPRSGRVDPVRRLARVDRHRLGGPRAPAHASRPPLAAWPAHHRAFRDRGVGHAVFFGPPHFGHHRVGTGGSGIRHRRGLAPVTCAGRGPADRPGGPESRHVRPAYRERGSGRLPSRQTM